MTDTHHNGADPSRPGADTDRTINDVFASDQSEPANPPANYEGPLCQVPDSVTDLRCGYPATAIGTNDTTISYVCQHHLTQAERSGWRVAPFATDNPTVTLCGSTRFRDTFHDQNRTLTLAGWIVMAPGVFSHTDGTVVTDAQKADLDALHQRKIDRSDEILVINPGGYIGDSTRAEIAYAERIGVPVRYLVPPETEHIVQAKPDPLAADARCRAHHDIARQLDTLAGLGPALTADWLDTCTPRPVTPQDWLRAVATKLRRVDTPTVGGSAPSLGSTPRAQEPQPQPFTFDCREDFNLRSAVFQALGAASMCWEHVAQAGEFDSAAAARIGDALWAEIEWVTGVCAQEAAQAQAGGPCGTCWACRAATPGDPIARPLLEELALREAVDELLAGPVCPVARVLVAFDAPGEVAAVRPQETPTIPTATQIQHEAALRGYHTAPAAGLVVDEQAEEPTPVSGTIGVSNRFARAAGQPRYARAAGHPAGGDWVRLRTGSGRQYEGWRSPTCPGDGQGGHQHDIRCVDPIEG